MWIAFSVAHGESILEAIHAWVGGLAPIPLPYARYGLVFPTYCAILPTTHQKTCYMHISLFTPNMWLSMFMKFSFNVTTVLSCKSTHGLSQLKHQKLRVGGCYMEEVLEWFDYPRASAHQRYKVSCQGVPNWPAAWSSLCPCFIKASPIVEKAVCARERTDL